ncbi:pseudouridine synthase [Chthonobacter rhizosphaerae]|uniref:pseudouridine synthase n=1 Tax=Chthonobacter rhizosphaerae TaxID=2735553 RepID=UPI001FEAE645|nr:pseudouridine synthase [Chthonobacter rhizosphaerae]
MKTPKTSTPAAPKSAPERIAKVIARAGLCSRREAEAWIEDGRVSLNGKTLATPAVTVGPDDVVLVDGLPLPSADRTRLWLFHKPRGCVTTTRDPEGRPTVFDLLPPDLPRVMTVGRLDINTEGLLLLTNDGGLARVLELPATGWLRRYRVRVHGDIKQEELDKLRDGVAIDGILYGAVEATLDSRKGDNAWLTMGLREGKNREVKNILGHLGLDVTRLIRVSFGPFQLGDLPDGSVEEVPRKVLKDQLGPTLVAQSGADFSAREEDRLPQMPVRRSREAEMDEEPMPTRSSPGRRVRQDAAPAVRDERGRRDDADRGRPARGRDERARPEQARPDPRAGEARSEGRPGRARAESGRQPDARAARRRHEADIEHAEDAAPGRRGRSRVTLSAKAGAERREREVTEVRQATRGDLRGRRRAEAGFTAEVRPRRERDLDDAAPRGRPDRGADGFDRSARPPGRSAGPQGRPTGRTNARSQPPAEEPESRRAQKIRLAREKRAGSPMPGQARAERPPRADRPHPEKPRADKPRPDTRLDRGDGGRHSAGDERGGPAGRGAGAGRGERPKGGRGPDRGEDARPRGPRPAAGARPEARRDDERGGRAGHGKRGPEGHGGPPRGGSGGPPRGGSSGPPRGGSSGPPRDGPGGGKPRGRDADRRR